MLNDYWNIVCEYEYLTITDGDLYVYDINETFNEIISALSNSEIAVASSDLWQGNNYLYQERKGLNEYISDSHLYAHFVYFLCAGQYNEDQNQR